jgi:hypothetical protein
MPDIYTPTVTSAPSKETLSPHPLQLLHLTPHLHFATVRDAVLDFQLASLQTPSRFPLHLLVLLLPVMVDCLTKNSYTVSTVAKRKCANSLELGNLNDMGIRYKLRSKTASWRRNWI